MFVSVLRPSTKVPAGTGIVPGLRPQPDITSALQAAALTTAISSAVLPKGTYKVSVTELRTDGPGEVPMLIDGHGPAQPAVSVALQMAVLTTETLPPESEA